MFTAELNAAALRVRINAIFISSRVDTRLDRANPTGDATREIQRGIARFPPLRNSFLSRHVTLPRVAARRSSEELERETPAVLGYSYHASFSRRLYGCTRRYYIGGDENRSRLDGTQHSRDALNNAKCRAEGGEREATGDV